MQTLFGAGLSAHTRLFLACAGLPRLPHLPLPAVLLRPEALVHHGATRRRLLRLLYGDGTQAFRHHPPLCAANSRANLLQPELRPEELALLEQNMGTESDRLNLETFGDLGEELGGELDSDLDKLNEDTFGDLDGLGRVALSHLLRERPLQ